jgi:hypothetical protein
MQTSKGSFFLFNDNRTFMDASRHHGLGIPDISRHFKTFQDISRQSYISRHFKTFHDIARQAGHVYYPRHKDISRHFKKQ